jgi:hypothetical protein
MSTVCILLAANMQLTVKLIQRYTFTFLHRAILEEETQKEIHNKVLITFAVHLHATHVGTAEALYLSWLVQSESNRPHAPFLWHE